MTTKRAVAVLLAVCLSGCARRVLLDPEAAAARNSKDWTVKSEPAKAGAAPAPAAGAPRKP